MKTLPQLALVTLPIFSSLATASTTNDLFGLELTQLMHLKVVSATKRPQTLADSATAIYVVSEDEIRRSAATTLPELLKLAPGVEVARINASTWAVTIRGFQSQFANKLLVLIDGRSVYTPFFSGVYWDAQMPMMEDIERIEIIRGPGSSLWGSNAVNGVINIITKNSTDTAGQLATAGIGNVEKGFVRARSGFDTDNGSLRFSAQYRSRDDATLVATGKDAGDDYNVSTLGVRADWRNDQQDIFTLQSDYVRTSKNNSISLHPYVQDQIPKFLENIGSDNANVLFRWTRPFEQGNSQVIQAYVDWSDRNESTYQYAMTTIDLDYQFNHRKTEHQQFTWGISYRWISDDFNGTYAFDLNDDALDYDQFTAFAQDEIYINEELTAIIGLKLEDTEFTDFEYQPSLRLIWNQNDDLTLWGAISRAIRTPSRAGRGIVVHNGIPEATEASIRAALPPVDGEIFGELRGNEQYESESLLAYELGIRLQMTEALFIDATTYYNDYHNLRTFDIGDPQLSVTPTGPASYIAILNLDYDNESDGHSEGFELAADWRPMETWQVKLSYTYFNFVAEPLLAPTSLGVSELSDQSPLHQAYLRSWHELGSQWEFDWTVKYYDELPNDDIKAYTDADFRLGYLVNDQLDISLVGKNVFASPRVEFEDTIQGPYRTEMNRSLYLQATWRAR